MQVKGIRKLFSFPGNVVEWISLHPEVVSVRLRWDKRFTLRCPACGAKMAKHRRDRRAIRDLPMGTAKHVIVNVEVVQGRCSSCGICHTFLPEGINDRARATWRFQQYVSGLARFMPLSAVAEMAGIVAATAYRWDRHVLETTLPPPDLDSVHILLVDEKAVRRRHGYVTLVMNAESGELLFMHEGRKKESLEAFFSLMDKDRKEHIEAVAMDRLGSYYEVVRRELPDADIVFDKFHLIANFNAVVDEVRRDEWRKASKEDKAFIKGQRYNLYRPWGTHPTEMQKYSLAVLLSVNENLKTVYVLKDALREVWTYRHRGYAKRYLEQWISWAMESGLEPVIQFAKNLKKVIPEVVNYCRHQITTGRLEGFNNLVSRIIHRACGIRNLSYLFLKLRQESLTCNQRI